MANQSTPAAPTRFITLLSIVLIVVVLSAGRDLLIPIALSVLFSFLLAPVVTWLERHHLGRVPAVIVVCLLCFMVIGVIGWSVVRQGLDLTAKLPEYRQNIEQRVKQVRPQRGGALEKAAETIREIQKEVADDDEDEAPVAIDEPAPEPEEKPDFTVEVVQPRQTAVGFLTSTAGGLLGPIGTASIVFVLVIFMLIGREDLRDRLIHLTGQTDLHVTTQALDDASSRVSRYLLMQLVVNLIYAVPVTLVLFFVGLPNALFWGLFGMLLRFIPYVGPITAAVLPIVLSLAVFDDWTRPLMVAGMYIVVETIVNNVVEPWLYGTSTGMSPIAVITSAVFWTWLWGPIGLLIATPLTATLVAFGKHVPQIGFLNVLLGDEPVGLPHLRLYQRLLAMDQEEAAEIAEEELEARGSLLEVYDDVLLPALQNAEEDRHRGGLGAERETFIRDSLAEIIDLLREHAPASDERAARSLRVVCLPARDSADELLGQVLVNLLESRGCEAWAVPASALTSDRIEAVEQYHAQVVCISALPPSATAHARHLAKRLRVRFPQVPLVAGMWLSPVPIASARRRIGCGEDDVVATTLRDAVGAVLQIASTPEPVDAEAPAAVTES